MENRNFTKKIDALLEGRMSTNERRDFKEEIAQDAALEQEVKEHLLEREAINLLLQEDYKAQIKAWRAEARTEKAESPSIEAKERTLQPRTRMRSLRPILSAAASILLLLVAGFWFANNSYSDRAMVSEAYVGSTDKRDRGTSLEENQEKGLQAFYQEEDYVKALNFFEKVQEPVTKNYYSGHTYLKLGAYAKAVKAFDSVLEVQDLPRYIDRSKLEYHRLLAQFGDGNNSVAFQQELDIYIQSARPPYKQKAQELKAKSESFWRGLVF